MVRENRLGYGHTEFESQLGHPHSATPSAGILVKSLGISDPISSPIIQVQMLPSMGLLSEVTV